ncbi:MAG: non-canonical purine NTP pyrophosphatase [Gemmatimonadota bacterium]|nr:non-canonical purine NTP pyrophosphatase [Gemmatimonadota bacterium]
MLLATRSAGKLRELRALFGGEGIEVLDLDDVAIPESAAEGSLERYETFAENALAKGRYFHSLGGLPTMADDSGLEVLALGGAPGVRSKRWSERTELTGEALDHANNERLLAVLSAEEDRRARYVCVAVYVDDDRSFVCRGETLGRVLRGARGTEGFGYDPLFESDELGGKTFGEVSTADKEGISHRGRAFRALLSELRHRG